MPFVGLPDPDHEVLDLYGQQFKILKMGRMPAEFVVDRSGLIQFVHYGKSMRDIATIEEKLAVLDLIWRPDPC